MPKIIILTDFDGTMTGMEGLTTTETRFYQSLLNGYVEGKIQPYYQPTFKEPDEVQSLFENEFDKIDANKALLLPPDAITFFCQALSNPDVTIHIITKNRIEYVEALLTFHGFSPEEIARFNIKAQVYKGPTANHIIQSALPDKVLIFDDNEDDCQAMMRGAIKAYSENNRSADAAGCFDWKQHLKSLEINPTQVVVHPITFGKFETYQAKPGCIYLKFESQEQRDAALKKFEELFIYKIDATDLQKYPNAAIYRTSRQDNTIEITGIAQKLIMEARELVAQSSFEPKSSSKDSLLHDVVTGSDKPNPSSLSPAANSIYTKADNLLEKLNEQIGPTAQFNYHPEAKEVAEVLMESLIKAQLQLF